MRNIIQLSLTLMVLIFSLNTSHAQKGNSTSKKLPERPKQVESNRQQIEDPYSKIDALKNRIKVLRGSVQSDWTNISRKNIAKKRLDEIDSDLKAVNDWFMEEVEIIRSYKMTAEKMTDKAKHQILATLATRYKKLNQIYKDLLNKLKTARKHWKSYLPVSTDIKLPPLKPPEIRVLNGTDLPVIVKKEIPSMSIEEAEKTLKDIDLNQRKIR